MILVQHVESVVEQPIQPTMPHVNLTEWPLSNGLEVSKMSMGGRTDRETDGQTTNGHFTDFCLCFARSSEKEKKPNNNVRSMPIDWTGTQMFVPSKNDILTLGWEVRSCWRLGQKKRNKKQKMPVMAEKKNR